MLSHITQAAKWSKCVCTVCFFTIAECCVITTAYCVLPITLCMALISPFWLQDFHVIALSSLSSLQNKFWLSHTPAVREKATWGLFHFGYFFVALTELMPTIHFLTFQKLPEVLLFFLLFSHTVSFSLSFSLSAWWSVPRESQEWLYSLQKRSDKTLSAG